MLNPLLAHKIIALKDADLALRDKLLKKGLLSEGYNADMQDLHIKNANALDEIMDEIGYPTFTKVGKEASRAAWLVIQHAISLPTFIKKCHYLLEQVIAENQAAPSSLAYLTDRIAVNEGRPQQYGTQYDWDENGQISPVAYDDLNLVNQRRKALGLPTMEEQTTMIRKRALNSNESPPKDLLKRNRERDIWRRSVGWID